MNIEVSGSRGSAVLPLVLVMRSRKEICEGLKILLGLNGFTDLTYDDNNVSTDIVIGYSALSESLHKGLIEKLEQFQVRFTDCPSLSKVIVRLLGFKKTFVDSLCKLAMLSTIEEGSNSPDAGHHEEPLSFKTHETQLPINGIVFALFRNAKPKSKARNILEAHQLIVRPLKGGEFSASYFVKCPPRVFAEMTTSLKRLGYLFRRDYMGYEGHQWCCLNFHPDHLVKEGKFEDAKKWVDHMKLFIKEPEPKEAI